MQIRVCSYRLSVLVLLIVLRPWLQSNAQCIPVTGPLPYVESFESGNGNWQAGGNASSWAWGTPSKPVINAASSGSRCWVTGGLTGGSYNSGEASWLQSPCFDFSSLTNPYIRFDLWWETERQYDGAALQYSTDDGLNWQQAVSLPGNCLDSNFYDNNSTVTFLSPLGAGPGWSGNVQSGLGNCLGGGGSGRWLRVAKTLEPLAGKPRVLLRIAFGAGTQCNDFDGIGFDHIRIDEAPANNGSIEFSCLNRTVAFRYDGLYCPQAYTWDFGDPGSGISNSSSLAEPEHLFSSGGRYRVSVTVSGPGNGSFTATSEVYVLATATAQLSRPGCDDEPLGSAVVAVSGADGPYNSLWHTNPEQRGDTIRNLRSGTYRVSVSADGACPVEDSITLISRQPQLVATVVQPPCGSEGGSISLQVSGGTAPYGYAWTPPVSSGTSASGLSTGDYRIVVTDAEGCTADTLIELLEGIPCNGIFFPGAFTPGKPGSNSRFGAAGSLSQVQEFSLSVYNRFGQLVFSARDPQLRWDGAFRGKEQPVGAYVWMTRYRIGNNPQRTRSGTVLLLR